MPAQEQWLPVPGFPDYAVSDQGNVASRKTGEPVLMRGSIIGGYRRVTLRQDGTYTSRAVHQLVAEAFIGPRPEGHEVRHLNGDALDNALGNIRWGERSENILDQVRHGTHVQARKTHCPSGHPFDAINTYVAPKTGARMCRACRRTNQRDYMIRRTFRAAGIAVSA